MKKMAETGPFQIKEGFLFLKDRKLDLVEIEFLLNNADNLSSYSDALNEVIFSFMRLISAISVSTKLDDVGKGAIVTDMACPEQFYLTQLLSNQLKKIEK